MSTARAILPTIQACQSLVLVAKAASVSKPKPEKEALPGLAFYRKYTEGMLRKYMRFSMEAGRVPSMLGREMFRGKVTSYQVHSFEDVVIFVHDVERCIARLNAMEQRLITRIAVQEYTHAEMAGMMGLPRRTVVRRYTEAVDCLTAIFLEVQLLEPLLACQEGGN